MRVVIQSKDDIRLISQTIHDFNSRIQYHKPDLKSSRPDKEVIAVRFRELREAAGLSKTDVARALNVDLAAVSRWEDGSSLPRASKLPKIADLYGCSIDALYGRCWPPQS